MWEDTPDLFREHIQIHQGNQSRWHTSGLCTRNLVQSRDVRAMQNKAAKSRKLSLSKMSDPKLIGSRDVGATQTKSSKKTENSDIAK